MEYAVSTELLQYIGFVFAGLFVVLGAFDGIYFHLVKYQLYLHAESRFEHQIHSVRGVFLGLIGGLILMTPHHGHQNANASSLSHHLYLAAFLVLLDLILEVVDIYVEKQSRMNLGGISSSEMVLHVFASSFRMAALVVLFLVAQISGFSLLVNIVGGLVAFISCLIGVTGLIPNSIFKNISIFEKLRNLGPQKLVTHHKNSSVY